MRRPYFLLQVDDSSPSGRVRRDDRGNAFWEWTREARTDELLQHAGLAIVEEAPPQTGNVTINRLAATQGYNPYQSGLIDRQARERARKPGLKELSNWIELRRRLGQDTQA
jgi:hypothetical protein